MRQTRRKKYKDKKLMSKLRKLTRRKAKGLLNISSNDSVASVIPKITDLRKILSLSNDKKLKVIGILSKILREGELELEALEYQINKRKMGYNGKHIQLIENLNFIRETLIQIENNTNIKVSFNSIGESVLDDFRI